NVASPIQQTTEPYDDMYHPNQRSQIQLNDYGKKPFVINIEEATKQNNTFRTAIWTGNHLQVTLMSIGVGDDIGLERHPTTDQFLRIEDGKVSCKWVILKMNSLFKDVFRMTMPSWFLQENGTM